MKRLEAAALVLGFAFLASLTGAQDFGEVESFLDRLRRQQGEHIAPRPAGQAPGGMTPAQTEAAAAAFAQARNGPTYFCSLPLEGSRPELRAKWRQVSGATVAGSRGPSVDGLGRRQLVERINSWVNENVRYEDDGADDDWQTAFETLRRREGDCEDFAIAKLQLLRAAGVPARDLYLAVVNDRLYTSRGACNRSRMPQNVPCRVDHALLLVREGGSFLVLDNRTDRVVEDSPLHGYEPTFSYSTEGDWTHGFPPGYRFGDPCPRPAP